MKKRKQKQLQRILAAKRAEKCGQFEPKILQGQIWDLAVQLQQLESRHNTQSELIRLLNRFYSKEISRLEKHITTDRIGDILLALIGGMIGGVVGMFMWILCIL